MIQLLRGNRSTLNASQQIFAEGQPIFEKDTQKLKIGNGVDIYSALKYIGQSSGSASLDIQEDGSTSLITYGNLVQVFASFLYLSDFYNSFGGPMDPGIISKMSWAQVTSGIYFLESSYSSGSTFSWNVPATLENSCPDFDLSGVTWVEYSLYGGDGNVLTTETMSYGAPINTASASVYWINGPEDTSPTSPSRLQFNVVAKGIRNS